MSPSTSADSLVWRKSTRSGGQTGNCVETADLPNGGRAIRNSKDPNGPMVFFTAAEWAAFVAGVQAGEDL